MDKLASLIRGVRSHHLLGVVRRRTRVTSSNTFVLGVNSPYDQMIRCLVVK